MLARLTATLLLATLAAARCGRVPNATPRHGVTFDELLAAPQPSAGTRTAYGPEALQFGELRLPPGRGPFPVAVVVHGGCWLAEYDLRHAARMAAALTAAGIATWTIEYRRVGDSGGGWPGTFEDVARGVDHLRALAATQPLDLTRVVLVGHSAGGQLALWAASRTRHPSPVPGGGDAPLAVRGVVSLAGITDLRAFATRPGGCAAAVPRLLGGSATQYAARYDAVDPIVRLPLGIPVRLVHGAADAVVPVELSRDYAARAVAAGDDAVVTVVPLAGHFDLVAPDADAWRSVERAVRDLLGAR